MNLKFEVVFLYNIFLVCNSDLKKTIQNIVFVFTCSELISFHIRLEFCHFLTYFIYSRLLYGDKSRFSLILQYRNFNKKENALLIFSKKYIKLSLF